MENKSNNKEITYLEYLQALNTCMDYVTQLKQKRMPEIALNEENIDTFTLIMDLDIDARTINCLNAANINTIGGLLCKSRIELLAIRGLGVKSLFELESFLENNNFVLYPV